MSCTINLSNPVIIINHIITKNTNKLYAFVGNELDNDIKKILKKIEDKKNITSSEESVVKNLSKHWKSWTTNDIKFIYDYIRLDDSINYIKNKIFFYLSNPEKKYFILEKNQELWVEPSDKEYKILGYHYVNKETNEIIKIDPSIYSKVEIDYNFVDKDGLSKDDYDIINQNLILYDAIDITNDKEYIIYLSNLTDFIKRLEKHKITTITDKLLDGYIKKYWPEVVIAPNLSKSFTQYKDVKKNIERDNKIINLVNTVKIDEEQFSSCNIFNTIIHINGEGPCNQIDLLKLFTFLRKNLSYQMPFIKYKDPVWVKPYSVVYDKAIQEKKIDESKLIDWIGMGRSKDLGDIKATKKITIKMKIYEYEDNIYYSDISINEKGKIAFNPSYREAYGASIHDVIKNIDELSDLMKMMNKSDALESKMELPEAKMEHNVLKTKENTKILSLSTISNFTPSTNINHNDLYNFSKIFTPFVSYKLDKEQTETRITLLYKRVSNFTNMNDIYKEINQQLQLGRSEMNIISYIVEKYDQTIKEATYLLSDFKKRHGGYSDYSLMKQTGIATCINLNKNNIHVNGATNFYLLVNANKFVIALLSMFEDRSYIKNKDFRQLILTSNQYIKLQKKEIEETLENIDEDINIEGLENIEDIDDFDLEDIELENENMSLIDMESEDYFKIVSNENEEELEKSGELVSDYKEGLADDSEIDPNIKLSCEDPLPELDTCKDLCNDRSYFLRRLQRHDPKLFNYNTPSEKYKKYSKVCQANNDIQPIVMRHNPEDDSNIDRESFTFALKYGSTTKTQNYYICPKVWCPYCQQPILFKKVKDVRKRMTVEGECTVGTCPNGDHDVFILTKNFYKSDKYDSGLYPGFSSSVHPDNLCLPCCFSRPQNIESSAKYKHYKQCLGEEVKDKDVEDNLSYILGSTSYLQEGRYGLLPTEISKIFGFECEQGFINKSCYLRKGVEYKDGQTFLTCIADIISEDKQIELDELKEYLVDKITPELFKTLNGGALEILFNIKDKKETAIDNFKSFIQSNEKIDETYLWDYLSRPNILYPEGLNIIIFTEESVICPVGYNIKEFYTGSKRTVFIIKYLKYYRPIYFVKYDDGEISVKKVFSSVDKHVTYILQILKNNCVTMPSINWKRILKDNEKKYNIQYDTEIEKEFTLIETMEALKSISNLKIVNQIVDYYNKCIGVLLNNGTYLPVLPSPLSIYLEPIHSDKIKLLDYKRLKENLEEIDKKTDINCKPKYKILSKDNKIVALILNTERIVPINPSNNITDNLPVKDIEYYDDANRSIYEGIMETDKRMEIVNQMEYENESYNRLRFELSKYLVKNNSDLEKIKNIIDSSEKMDKKRKDIYDIITNIVKKIVSTKDKTINFSKYVTPNTRTICYDNDECVDPHCIKDGNKCKLHIFSKNLLTGKDNIKSYTDIIVEELLRNRMKREDILDDNISEIIDIQQLIQQKNEIIFFGKEKNDFEKITELYHKEQHIYINNIEPFDTLEPKFYGIDKEYREVSTTTIEPINLEPLSIYWGKILSDNYFVYKTKDGVLFEAFARGLNYISMNNKENLTATNLRQNLSNYDITEDVINEIVKNLDINLESDNNDHELLLKLYKTESPKIYKDIGSIPELKSYMTKQSYDGTLIDIYILSKMYKINVIILDNRLKKDSIGMKIINQPDSSNYILLYSQFYKDRYLYNIVENRGKYIFNKYDFNDRFRELVNDYEDKKLTPFQKAKTISKKIKIKKPDSGIRKIKIKKPDEKDNIKIKIKKPDSGIRKIKIKKPDKKDNIKIKIKKI